MSDKDYEIAFAEGEAYALNSLVTEWQEFKDNYGNKVLAIPHYEVVRLAKRLTGKYKMLKSVKPNNDKGEEQEWADRN